MKSIFILHFHYCFLSCLSSRKKEIHTVSDHVPPLQHGENKFQTFFTLPVCLFSLVNNSAYRVGPSGVNVLSQVIKLPSCMKENILFRQNCI